MDNPYTSPISSAVSQPAIDFRNVPMVQLQLIVVGLISGPVFNAAYDLYGSDWSHMSARWNELTKLEYWGYALQIFLASFIVPWMIGRFGVSRLRGAQEQSAAKVFNLYQSQLLVGIALLLSVVYYGLFWFSGSAGSTGSRNLAFLLLAAAYEGVIISRFPTRKRLEKWWIRRQPFEVRSTA